MMIRKRKKRTIAAIALMMVMISSTACEQLFAEGNAINFITWESGTVLNGGNGSEHMASFDYAYKLEKVRDWLFEQHK